ncbi:MAG: hypothetical protein AAFR03_13965 [Pseudomonadota bacterium]
MSVKLRRVARALAIGWCVSLMCYWGFSATGMSWPFAVIDVTLAVYFFRQSRGSLIPVPLFFIHAAMVFYYLLISLLNVTVWYWIVLFANRSFEMSLIYIAVCSIIRIRSRNDEASGGILL